MNYPMDQGLNFGSIYVISVRTVLHNKEQSQYESEKLY